MQIFTKKETGSKGGSHLRRYPRTRHTSNTYCLDITFAPVRRFYGLYRGTYHVGIVFNGVLLPLRAQKGLVDLEMFCIVPRLARDSCGHTPKQYSVVAARDLWLRCLRERTRHAVR